MLTLTGPLTVPHKHEANPAEGPSLSLARGERPADGYSSARGSAQTQLPPLTQPQPSNSHTLSSSSSPWLPNPSSSRSTRSKTSPRFVFVVWS